MPGTRSSLARVIAVGARIDDDEAAAAGVVLAHERQARSRLIVPLDDHVLEQVAETGFDRALVAAVDLEIVGHRALLTDVAVGLHEHHPGGVAEIRTAGASSSSDASRRLDGGQLLLARAHVSRAPFVLASRASRAPTAAIRAAPA